MQDVLAYNLRLVVERLANLPSGHQPSAACKTSNDSRAFDAFVAILEAFGRSTDADSLRRLVRPLKVNKLDLEDGGSHATAAKLLLEEVAGKAHGDAAWDRLLTKGLEIAKERRWLDRKALREVIQEDIPSRHAGASRRAVIFLPLAVVVVATLFSTRDGSSTSLLATLKGHTGQVWSAAFAPGGKVLATGGTDGAVRLWDLTDPAVPRPLGQPLQGQRGVTSVAFAPGGKVLATGGEDRTVRLWDVADPAQPRQLARLKGQTDRVISVAFAPNGNTLAAASYDQTVRLWDVADPAQPRQLATLEGHIGPVLSVAFAPGGKVLATGGGDRTVRLWDVADPSHPRQLARLEGHTDRVISVAFAPGGATLASGSDDNTVRMWAVADPRPHGQPLTGHTDNVFSVAFAPDEKILASASWDETVRLWAVR
jgi:WD40 repeat protein